MESDSWDRLSAGSFSSDLQKYIKSWRDPCGRWSSARTKPVPEDEANRTVKQYTPVVLACDEPGSYVEWFHGPDGADELVEGLDY